MKTKTRTYVADKARRILVFPILLILIAVPLFGQEEPFRSKSLVNDTVTASNGAVTTADALKANEGLGAERKVVDEIVKGVYHIRGWGIAHTIAIDAPEGFIIVDTGDSTATAAEMRSALEEKLGRKVNVAAILYTHSHYTDGTDAWLDEGAQIWGHEDLDKNKRADTGVNILSGNFGVRAAIQFGVLHPAEGPNAFPNKFGFSADKMLGEQSYRPPTNTFEDGKILKLTIAGEPIEVAPNRTDVQDSVGFYFPNRSTLVTNAVGGNTIFNLYSLRGDIYRNPMEFVDAHDWALSKEADALVDIHGPGVKGKRAVREALELARDQMQLIHDQTFRMIALGMDARRCAENVYMPSHMRQGREVYGQLESHVKQVYNARIGWMGNDVYDINPLSVNEESRRTVEMMGGVDKVRAAADDSANKGGFENWSWALRLTSMLLELNPVDEQTKAIRAKAARAIGQRTTSANARGWYITEALAMENKLRMGGQPVTLELVRKLLGTPDADQVKALPLEDSFEYVRYLVDPHKAEDMRLKFSVMVEGTSQPYGVELRNGIVVISKGAKAEEVHLVVTLKQWSEFVAGERSFATKDKTLARFESVLDRIVEPEGTETLDKELSDAIDQIEENY